MEFRHADSIWRNFPELAAGVVLLTGVDAGDDAAEAAGKRLQPFLDTAQHRLAGVTEADLPEIRAWRAAFARMGLKPTQYRCAAESLLRRFRREGALPSINPLVDLCNAVSLASAIPVAAFDVAHVSSPLMVREATGTERYRSFSGETEHPYPGEVIFADASGEAHARRWSHRQSARSAVSAQTSSALIVAEAMHESAPDAVGDLVSALTAELHALWPQAAITTALLSREQPVACG
jgi:DNA/RNA-binding domain of Phe-tRNA-synthetase-like protein